MEKYTGCFRNQDRVSIRSFFLRNRVNRYSLKGRVLVQWKMGLKTDFFNNFNNLDLYSESDS